MDLDLCSYLSELNVTGEFAWNLISSPITVIKLTLYSSGQWFRSNQAVGNPLCLVWLQHQDTLNVSARAAEIWEHPRLSWAVKRPAVPR